MATRYKFKRTQYIRCA